MNLAYLYDNWLVLIPILISIYAIYTAKQSNKIAIEAKNENVEYIEKRKELLEKVKKHNSGHSKTAQDAEKIIGDLKLYFKKHQISETLTFLEKSKNSTERARELDAKVSNIWDRKNSFGDKIDSKNLWNTCNYIFELIYSSNGEIDISLFDNILSLDSSCLEKIFKNRHGIDIKRIQYIKGEIKLNNNSEIVAIWKEATKLKKEAIKAYWQRNNNFKENLPKAITELEKLIHKK